MAARSEKLISSISSAPAKDNQFLCAHVDSEDIFSRDFRAIFSTLLTKSKLPDTTTLAAKAVLDPLQRKLKWGHLADHARDKPKSRTASTIVIYKQLKAIEFNYSEIIVLGYNTSDTGITEFLDRLQNFLIYFKSEYTKKKSKDSSHLTHFRRECPLLLWVFNEEITDSVICQWTVEKARKHVINVLCHALLYQGKSADRVVRSFLAKIMPESTAPFVMLSIL